MNNQKQTPVVFETMVKPTHPEIEKALTGWRPPKTAYILLEQPVLHIISEGEREWGMGLVTYNAESRVEVLGWVDNTLRKGGRILHYGNFPRLDSSNPKRVEKAMLYGGSKGSNPWDVLAKELDVKMAADTGLQSKIASQQEELDALRAKLAALEAAKAPVTPKKEKENGSLHTKE